MRIAVASGKGGTGKTTVSVSLAKAAGENARLLDCDVEEPNCHLFLCPEQEQAIPVAIRVPRVDAERCSLCGKCATACEFNAIIALPRKVLVYEDLCHGCGACSYVCPEGAITEANAPIGEVRASDVDGLHLVRGLLTVGKAQAPPVIRAVLRHAMRRGVTIIDAPPGTSCPMVTATRHADFVILVSELTPFGLHDLSLAIDTLEPLGVPMGIIINRFPEKCRGDLPVDPRVPILLRIPESRRIAEVTARGGALLDAMPALRPHFERILKHAAGKEACT